MSTSPASQKAVGKPKTTSTPPKPQAQRGRWQEGRLPRKLVGVCGGHSDNCRAQLFSKGHRNIVVNNTRVPQDPFPFLDLDSVCPLSLGAQIQAVKGGDCLPAAPPETQKALPLTGPARLDRRTRMLTAPSYPLRPQHTPSHSVYPPKPSHWFS